MTQGPIEWRRNLAIGALAAGALLGTMVWLALPRLPPQLLQFVAEHGNIASALLRGQGFADPFGTPSGPTAWVPPVFPFYVTAVFAVFGIKSLASVWAMIVLDAVFAALCVLCTAAALDLCGMPALKPWLAAVIVALTWLQELASGPWISTGWFVAALDAVFLMAAAGAHTDGRSRWWWTMAASASALSLTHAGSAFGCWVVVCGLWLLEARRRATVTNAGGLRAVMLAAGRPLSVLAACALAIGIWTARNWSVFHQIIPLKSAGWFEIYLAESYTNNGVIDDAVMLGHHPFSNPRLLVEYTAEGEARFLEAYRPNAKALVEADPMSFVRHVGDRALSVFSYCDTAPHAFGSRLRFSHADAAALVLAGLGARLTDPNVVIWTSLGLPTAEFEHRLQALPLGDPRVVLKDWMAAKAAMLDGETRLTYILSSFALAGLPTACLLGTLALRRRRTDVTFALFAAFYVSAVLPNVLITHYASHQLHFLCLHAFFIVCFGSALVQGRPGSNARAPAPN
jgi:hypothetical protein